MDTHIRFRLSSKGQIPVFVVILFLISIVMLNAQVRIKEKVEIKPKTIPSGQLRTSSNNLKFFEGSIEAGSATQTFSVLRPCMIEWEGSITGSGDYANSLYVYISYNNMGSLANGSGSFEVNCGQAEIHIGSAYTMSGAVFVKNVSGNIRDDGATICFDGVQSFTSTIEIPFTAQVELHAIPIAASAAAGISLEAYPTILYDGGQNTSYILATVYDGEGRRFSPCGWAGMTFTIVNPIAGVSFDGGNLTSYTQEIFNGEGGINLYWEGDSLPAGKYTVDVLVEALDVSSVQPIELKNIEIDHFDVTITPDTIYTDGYARLTAIAIDKDGNEVLLNDNASINISANPDSNIYYRHDVVYSDLRWGIYLYPDNMYAPIQNFEFTVSRNGASGTAKLVVQEAPCMILSISKTKMQPGESATITMKQKTWDGTVKPYPADQVFIVWTNVDEQYGRVRSSSGDEGSYAYGEQPFTFISADNIDVDSIVVEIEASAGGGVASSIGSVKDTLRLPVSVIANQQAKAKNHGKQQAKVKKIGLEFEIDRLQTLLSKKDNEKQKRKLANILEKQKSQLAYETAKTPTEKQKAIAKIKQTAMLDDGTACIPKETVTIKKEDCPNIKYDEDGKPLDYPGITKGSQIIFNTPGPSDNSQGCDNTNPKQAGATGGNIEMLRSIGDKNGSVYVEKIEITIPWGYCIDKIKNLVGNNGNSLKLVDENTNYPTTKAEALLILADFKKWDKDDNYHDYFSNMKYYPLPKTREHERYHLEQEYKEGFIRLFNEELKKVVNQPLPPDNWCKDNAYQEILSNQKSKIRFSLDLTLHQIFSQIMVEPNDLVNDVGYKGLKDFMDKIQNDIDQGRLK